MALPSGILGPAIGGFISGIVGLATVIFRDYREDRAERDAWYTATARLAERVRHGYTGEEQYDPDAKRYVQSTVDHVQRALADHVSQAPATIDDETLRLCEDLISDCQEVSVLGGDRLPDNNTIAERNEIAADTARKLKRHAEAQR